jgi:hypothetical protein
MEAACGLRGFTPRVVSQTDDYLAMQGSSRRVYPLVHTTSMVRRGNGHRPLAAEPLREVLRKLVPTLGASRLPHRRVEPV